MCYRNTSFLMYLNTSKSCLILCDPMDCFSQTSLSFTNPGVCTNSHPLSWWGYPTISTSVSPSAFPSIRNFSSESALYIRWSNIGASLSVLPVNSGLISFGIDWYNLLALQEALKCLLQHHNLNASVLWHSAFFMVQLSHLYMTTGKL